MAIWLALLGAPLLVLTDLSVAYALVTPACARQSAMLLHLVSLWFLVLTILLAIQAARLSRRLRTQDVLPDSDHAGNRRYQMALIATGVAALSALVIVARWIPQWLLSPCVS
jgi:hypothetical protein